MSDPRVVVLGSKSVGLTVARSIAAVGSVQLAVITIDDIGDTRTALSDLLRLQQGSRCTVEIADSTEGAYNLIRQYDPIAVIVAGWYWLIPSNVRALVDDAFYGLHFSLLPNYRGFAPVVWAMLANDPLVGYTIFRMADGIDDGPIAAQGAVGVLDRPVGEVLGDLERASSQALVELLPAIVARRVHLVPQSSWGVSYCGARSSEDGYIDWTKSADAIARFVRAQTHPYPGAYSRHDRGTVRIWRTQSDHSSKYFGIPGQVVRIGSLGPVVCCGERTGLCLVDYEAFDDAGHPMTLNLNVRRLRFH